MTEPRETQTDIVIVGGGLAGLLAAAHAAENRTRVLLIDRGPLGGRGRSDTTPSGFTLNHGPHALYADQALHTSLVDLGIPVAGAAPPQGGQGLVGDHLGLLPGGFVSLLQTDLVPAAAKPQLALRLAAFGRKRPGDHAGQSISEWLDGERFRPEIRRLLAGLVRLTTYCADHDIASADMAITQIQLALSTGVLYLDGGWQRLVDSLAALLEQRGVTIRSSTPARAVDGGTVILDDGTTIDAGAVIVAGLGPEAVAGLVPGSTPGADLRTLAGPPVEAATLDLGVRGEPDIGFVLGLDEPLYYSRHDPPAALAPDGHSLYAAMRYLRRDEEHDHKATAAQLQALAHRAGLSPEDIVESRYAHRLRVANGLPLASRGGLAGRPAVDALNVPGVYLAGDWVGPTGALADASAASARVAAEAAIAHAANGRVAA